MNFKESVKNGWNLINKKIKKTKLEIPCECGIEKCSIPYVQSYKLSNNNNNKKIKIINLWLTAPKGATPVN